MILSLPADPAGGRIVRAALRMAGSAGPLMPMAAAVVLAVAGLLAAERLLVESLSRQMAQHVLLMCLVAPLLAIGLVRAARPASDKIPLSLVAAVAAQVAILYLWHLPASHALAMRHAWGMAAMQTSLLFAGIGFWTVVIANLASRRWHAVAALLATGKLFCLLGILLVFARRPLYAAAGLADQQLAGLLMLGACPIIYVAAAFVIACQGIRASPPDGPRNAAALPTASAGGA